MNLRPDRIRKSSRIEKRAAQLQTAADQWNSAHPIGTPVTRYKLLDPLREGNETTTRSEAWVMGGHSVMVMVNGVSGGVLLESVVPLPTSSTAH
jgi:hypothetical protein